MEADQIRARVIAKARAREQAPPQQLAVEAPAQESLPRRRRPAVEVAVVRRIVQEAKRPAPLPSEQAGPRALFLAFRDYLASTSAAPPAEAELMDLEKGSGGEFLDLPVLEKSAPPEEEPREQAVAAGPVILEVEPLPWEPLLWEELIR